MSLMHQESCRKMTMYEGVFVDDNQVSGLWTYNRMLVSFRSVMPKPAKNWSIGQSNVLNM